MKRHLIAARNTLMFFGAIALGCFVAHLLITLFAWYTILILIGAAFVGFVYWLNLGDVIEDDKKPKQRETDY